jgi:hypothetical protein
MTIAAPIGVKDQSRLPWASMALSTFCTTCHRTVYIREGDTPICPVCSSPLVQTIDPDDSADGRDQMEGTK